MKPIVKTIIWLTIFSIAMGYLETSVVVYLRKLYYPGGFRFPLIPVTRDIATTEFWREAATIIMLIGAGAMAGKNGTQRFVFFLYSFAIWDIFYYVFLKVLLDWPTSLFTWDILFLIPVPWVGPVIAPCIISLSMIVLALMVIYFQEQEKTVRASASPNGCCLFPEVLSPLFPLFGIILVTFPDMALIPGYGRFQAIRICSMK